MEQHALFLPVPQSPSNCGIDKADLKAAFGFDPGALFFSRLPKAGWLETGKQYVNHGHMRFTQDKGEPR